MNEHTVASGRIRTTARPPRLFGIVARRALVPPLSRPEAARVAQIADKRYVPPSPLAHTSAGRFDLRMAAYLVALRDALVQSGTAAPAAGDLLGDAVYRVLRRLQRPLDLLAAAAHPNDESARTRFREQLARRLLYRPPDWVMTDVGVPGCYAFDVHRCVYADYFRGRGEGPFCEQVLCAQDHRMAERRGQPLRRAGTIAGGADRCDFRYVLASRGGDSSQRTYPGDRAGVR